jgi:hypothetical protein
VLTMRTAAQIRNARSVKGFRACAGSTGVFGPGLETSRLLRAELGRSNRELRRRWLARRWNAHQVRVATNY